MNTHLDFFSWLIVIFCLALMAWAAVHCLGAAVDWQGFAELIRAVRG